MARKKEPSSETEQTQDSAEPSSVVEPDQIPEAEIVETTNSDALPPQDVSEPSNQKHTPSQTSGSKSGGLFAGLLGGAFGGLGIFAALWTFAPNLVGTKPIDTAPLTAGLNTQAQETETLKARVETLTAQLETLRNTPPNTGDGFETRIGTLEADINTRIAELSSTIDRQTSTLSILEGRLAQVEARPPVFSGDASEETGALIAHMRTALETQRAEIDALANAAQESLKAAEAQATQLRENTQTAANVAIGRAALARLMAAMDAGGPFAQSLSDLAEATNQPMPEALTSQADTGVPTLVELRQSFPDAARAALAATARADLDDEAGLSERLGAFLKAQTGARSLEPREGGSPDAVLSRAEAALKDNQIEDSIALIDQLPEAGQTEMAEWRKLASIRLSAVTAAQTLARSLAEN